MNPTASKAVRAPVSPANSNRAWQVMRAVAPEVGGTRGRRNPVQSVPANSEQRVQQTCAAMSTLVRKIAFRVARRLPSHVEVDDLIGAGAIGLILAVRQHLNKPRPELERLAVRRIRGAILDHLRAADPLTRRQRAAVTALSRARTALENDGIHADLPEVARHIGIPLRRVEQIDSALANVQLTAVPCESVADEHAVLDSIMQRERQRRLAAALSCLPERLQTLLALYYYDELTYHEISRVLRISRSRVCQLHTQALAVVRRSLGERALEL